MGPAVHQTPMNTRVNNIRPGQHTAFRSLWRSCLQEGGQSRFYANISSTRLAGDEQITAEAWKSLFTNWTSCDCHLQPQSFSVFVEYVSYFTSTFGSCSSTACVLIAGEVIYVCITVIQIHRSTWSVLLRILSLQNRSSIQQVELLKLNTPTQFPLKPDSYFPWTHKDTT